jgi:hypothetical protein
MLEPVNYKYLGIAILFLLITYYFLENTKKKIRTKELKDSYKSSIKVLTQKGEIQMDSNIFEMHMTRLKTNIVNLHKQFDKGNCPKLKKYLDKAKKNTTSYIKMNIKTTDNSFCDPNKQHNLFDDNILQEIELLKNKMSNKTETDDGDDGDDGDISDKLRYNLLELTTDIDVILFLIRSSFCKKGALDLSSLDQVILELYRAQCSVDKKISDKTEMFKANDGDVCGLNTQTPCYGGINNYHDALNNTRLGLLPESISRCVPTQDNTDTVAMPIKETFSIKPINNNTTTQSQGVDKPFDCNKVRMGKQLYISDYSRNRLEWYNKSKYMGKLESNLDTNHRSCMRDDYNNLKPMT